MNALHILTLHILTLCKESLRVCVALLANLACVMPISAVAVTPHESDQVDTCQPHRVIALGGTVTEIVFALNQEHSLVGVDLSSVYPVHARAIPTVGYYRHVPAEGLLRLQPDLIIASENSGPPHVIEQLKALGIRIQSVSDQASLESLHLRIDQVAALLCVPEHGQGLRLELDQQMARVTQIPVLRQDVMMVIMRAGKLLGAGRDTHAAKIIELAGLDNILNDYSGYRPVSAEIASVRQPSALIVTSSSVQSMGGMQSVRTHPALRTTPAVLRDQIIELDDLLAQGIGPRVPRAIETIRHSVSQK